MDLIESFHFYSFLLFLFYKPIQNGSSCHFIAFEPEIFLSNHEKRPRQTKFHRGKQAYKIRNPIPKA